MDGVAVIAIVAATAGAVVTDTIEFWYPAFDAVTRNDNVFPMSAD